MLRTMCVDSGMAVEVKKMNSEWSQLQEGGVISAEEGQSFSKDKGWTGTPEIWALLQC